MGEAQQNLVLNHKFIVTLNLDVFSFSKVTNLTGTMELETWNEGGYNDSPRFFPKPKSTVDTLILERGVQTTGPDNGFLQVGMPVNMASIIICHGASIAKTYSFEYGLVTKWEIGELDAMGSSLVIRRVEISHTGLFEL